MSAARAAGLTVTWLVTALSMATLTWLAAMGAPFGLVQNSGLLLVGALIVTSRPGNRVGWLMLAGGAMNIPTFTLEVPGFAAGLPIAAELLFDVSGALSSLVFALAVLVYPTGRIVTRAGRVLGVILGVIAVAELVLTLLNPRPLFSSGRANPLGVPWLSPVMGTNDGAIGALDILWLSGILVALGALIELAPRWRASSGAERLQYRWFAFGVVAVLVGVVVAIAGSFSDRALMVYALSVNAIPLSIWVAITRHGLYEINRVVSRTVAYAIVTIIAVCVCAAVVTSVTWLLPGAPALAVAAATLAAAALFLPVLRAVQRRLDRRFDRERYDAQKVVDDFGARLRTEVDPATTASDLRRAAERSLQPVSVGVWLANRSGPR